jgi:hypothetical protein
VRLLTTNTEEIGRVHAGGLTVFGIVPCNRFELTEAELLTPSPIKRLQHGVSTDFSKLNEDRCRVCIILDGYVQQCLVLVEGRKFPLYERMAHGPVCFFGLHHVVTML